MMTIFLRPICLIIYTVSFALLNPVWANEVALQSSETHPQVEFGISKIENALQAHGHQLNRDSIQRLIAVPTIKLQIKPNKAESFQINSPVIDANVPQTITVTGGDSAGLMYGCLELAEQINIGGLTSVTSTEQTAHMQMRGTKFNIPLDVRTPSYTDMSDSAQLNMEHMWDYDFWTEYIDTLATYRYNYISLWSLHPFPSMVKVPTYPEVALDNVHRSTTNFKEHYATTAIGYDAPEIVENYEIIKHINIDEKIAFWQKVMAYGKSRNIDFYIITWNIFDYGTKNKYGINDRIDNPVTKDYFRQSVKQLLLTYPDLRGMGITMGENMHGASFLDRENWAFETYGQAILDVAAEQPERKIRFIHRQHQTRAEDIQRIFKPLIDDANIDFIFSFKYAKAHIYSSTRQNYHEDFIKDIGETKTIWTLRNDDTFFFRWGSPDFVRDFVNNIPTEPSQGYYVGSDQFVWGREFMDINVDEGQVRQLEIKKHWFQWLLWGRLGYNPDINNDRFLALLHLKFPELSAAENKKLFHAWQGASYVYPLVTGLHWGALDFQWYIEGSKSRTGPAQTPTGFHDINRFISLPPHPTSSLKTIPQYVADRLEDSNNREGSPIFISSRIDMLTNSSLEKISKIDPRGNAELANTLEDIRSVSYLGKYYSRKIRAAVQLETFRQSGNLKAQAKAQTESKHAAEFWRLYASHSLSRYKSPVWFNRVGYVDWRKTFDDVLFDITQTGGDHKLAPMPVTQGGTILEAETSNFEGAHPATEYAGFTGKGYLRVYSESEPWIEWTFTAPKTATYLLELRYAVSWWSDEPIMPITINSQAAGEFVYYRTGSPTSWSWDRVPVLLTQGLNTIRIRVNRSINVDHLNIIETAN